MFQNSLIICWFTNIPLRQDYTCKERILKRFVRKEVEYMATNTKVFQLKTNKKQEFVFLDSQLEDILAASGVLEGIVIVYSSHTTGAITINENADPDVRRDLSLGMNETFPDKAAYVHMEGNSDGHMKSSVVGASETLIFQTGSWFWEHGRVFISANLTGRERGRYMLKSLKDKA